MQYEASYSLPKNKAHRVPGEQYPLDLTDIQSD